jgi:glucose/arabinose dehydrogenase
VDVIANRVSASVGFLSGKSTRENREAASSLPESDEDGSKPVWRPFASGLRNPIGFDWHLDTGVLYASNNGPDHWGFELPPEYFSSLVPGSFHGMPWFQFGGENLRRDNCIRAQPPRPADGVERPVATFPARSAPMAVAFVPRGAMSPDLEGDAIVALRGCWATRPQGRASGNPATRREPRISDKIESNPILTTAVQPPRQAQFYRNCWNQGLCAFASRKGRRAPSKT